MERELALRIERVMRRIATVVSIVAVALMIVGYAGAFLPNALPPIPGAPALPPQKIFTLQGDGWGLWAMSTGIFLLALLPPVSVLLAFAFFVRKRRLLDAAVALVVLLELFISMQIKG